MSKPKFPITVKHGHTVVKIYRTPTRGFDSFTVAYYQGDKRIRKTFADLGLATTEAETVANKMSTGELNVLKLTSDDRLAYVRAMEVLKPIGVSLEMAVIQFAEAYRLLDGESLQEAVRFYMKKNPNRLPKKSIPDLVEELIQAKSADGLSDVYLRDIKGRLGRFAEAFPGPVHLLTCGEIEAFLRGLKGKTKSGAFGPLSGTSRNNSRRVIGTLINFATARGYLTKGALEVSDLSLAREQAVEIGIFRPEEMRWLLETADASLLPFLAIGAFAGLRHAELQRLDWSEVRMEEGFIEVKAAKAKTASRRLVPIPDNLKQWLTPCRKAAGPVCAYSNMTVQLLALAQAVDKKIKASDPEAKFIWKHNALRHSYISYRVADIKNVAQVALEAGNSPQMIFQHYRELVRPEAAKAWFAIVTG